VLFRSGSGLQLSPNALHALTHIGLDNQIRSASSAPDSIRVIKARTGKEIARIPLGNTALERYRAPYLVIHRADLCQVLARACHDHPDIDLHLASELIDVVRHPNGVTAMSLHHGKISEITGIAMIAADGVWSKFRTEYLEAKPPEFSGLVAWRGMIPVDHVDPERLRHTELWLAPQSHGVTYGIRNYRYLNVVAVTGEKQAEKSWDLAGEIKGLKRATKGWDKAFTSLFEHRVKWTRWPLYKAPKAKSWAVERVALIGDAAHAMLPFAAQGAAMAIEDAWIIARELSSNDDVDAALQRYSKTRMPRAMRAVKLAQTNQKIYHLRGPEAFVRDMVMKYTPPERLLARQDWLYKWRG